MSKPILEAKLETFDGKTGHARAVFDSGASVSLVREDCVPPGAYVVLRPKPRILKTACQEGKLSVVGVVVMKMAFGDHVIEDEVQVSPDLAREMLIGVGTMQKWDISVITKNGGTHVDFGRDLFDPEMEHID